MNDHLEVIVEMIGYIDFEVLSWWNLLYLEMIFPVLPFSTPFYFSDNTDWLLPHENFFCQGH